MRNRSIATLLCLAMASPIALACKENIECKEPGTRCINPDQAAGGFCGPWQTKDSVQPKMSVIGESPRPSTSKRTNQAVTGEACSTDRDCPSGKACVRPSTSSAWRCVAR